MATKRTGADRSVAGGLWRQAHAPPYPSSVCECVYVYDVHMCAGVIYIYLPKLHIQQTAHNPARICRYLDNRKPARFGCCWSQRLGIEN